MTGRENVKQVQNSLALSRAFNTKKLIQTCPPVEMSVCVCVCTVLGHERRGSLPTSCSCCFYVIYK